MTEASTALAPAEDLALDAWRRFRPGSPEPTSLELVHDSGFPLKAVVYRLGGVGADGSDLIAKRSRMRRALRELLVYEQVLPLLPVRTPAFHGSAPEPDDAYCWLFFEDIGGARITPAHAEPVAEWLARLHTSALSLEKRLPPGIKTIRFDHYLKIVQTSLLHIDSSLQGDDLPARSRELLVRALEEFELVEEFWDDLVRLCAGLPPTLVHGHFLERNVFVDPAGEIVALDWENCSWTHPAIDLASVDARHYHAHVANRWPELSVQAIEGAGGAGLVFREIARLGPVTEGLPSPGSVRRLKHRRRMLAESLHALGWS